MHNKGCLTEFLLKCSVVIFRVSFSDIAFVAASREFFSGVAWLNSIRMVVFL